MRKRVYDFVYNVKTHLYDRMICDFFHPNVGGVENHIYMLSANLIRQGHKIRTFTYAGKLDAETILGHCDHA